MNSSIETLPDVTLSTVSSPKVSLQLSLLMICFTSFESMPPKDEKQSRLAVLLKAAAPYVIGTMLGVQGDSFRRDAGVNLRILFGLNEPEMIDQS